MSRNKAIKFEQNKTYESPFKIEKDTLLIAFPKELKSLIAEGQKITWRVNGQSIELGKETKKIRIPDAIVDINEFIKQTETVPV
jgi:hypothetical protein